MPRFRMKSVQFDARQWDGTAASAAEIVAWILAGGMSANYDNSRLPDGVYIVINTKNGPLHGSPQDWFVQGAAGEFSVYKPDVFVLTADPA